MAEPMKEQIYKWRSEFEAWIREPVEYSADTGKCSNGEYIDYVTYLK